MDVIGQISQHHDSGGWAAVLLLAFALSAGFVGRWLRSDIQSMRRRCRDVLRHPPHRLMTGTCLIFLGAVVRIAALLPEKPMRLARAWDWTWWWGGFSWWLVDLGALLIVAGLTVMMWPALHGRLGRWTLPAIVAGAAAVYGLGAAGVEIASRFFM
jgi:hypothetical protein